MSRFYSYLNITKFWRITLKFDIGTLIAIDYCIAVVPVVVDDDDGGNDGDGDDEFCNNWL